MKRNQYSPLVLGLLAFLLAAEGVVYPPNFPNGSPLEKHPVESRCSGEVWA
jgi:hypothetical protein